MKKRQIILLLLPLLAAVILVTVLAVSYYIVNPNKKFVISPRSSQKVDIGIVLGAGVAGNGKPYKELQARLDVAADQLNRGIVKKLILSGDNRFENYDEPSAMLKYLVNNRNIATDKLQRDYAGRSTYESCERAAKVFGVKKTIIFSAGSHLPRAIYLCRHFGIEAYGISSGVEANNSNRRELLARVKAVYNAQLIGEKTVLGDSVSVK